MADSLLFRTRPSGATVTASWDQGLMRLVVTGEVDAGVAADAASLVEPLSESATAVAVDLVDVTFFCAAGVGWLIELDRLVPGGIRVVAASECVRAVVALCGVEHLLPAGRAGEAGEASGGTAVPRPSLGRPA